MHRQFRRAKRHQVSSQISLTPLIDTALTLLIIVMMITPILKDSVQIDIPKVSGKKGNPQLEPIIVYVDQDERFFFEKQECTKKLLIEKIIKILDGNTQVVSIKADKKASYGAVMELADEISLQAQVEKVALVMEHRDAQG